MKSKSEEACDLSSSDVDTNDDASRKVLAPVVLLPAGQSIVVEGTASMFLYQLSRSVLSFASKQGSTVIFERVEHEVPEKITSTESIKQRNQCLFYLLHSVHAKYQIDVLAYYVTFMSSNMIDNI
jgi:hypothetical protein